MQRLLAEEIKSKSPAVFANFPEGTSKRDQ